MRIRADARCPNTYYEEMMKKDFNKWSKMQLVAFINMNSDENNQVTMRPRKSTLVKRAENMQLMCEAEECCKVVKPKEHIAERIAGWLVLALTFTFLGLIVTSVVARGLGWID